MNKNVVSSQELINTWLEIAQNNVWIRQRGSFDPEDDCAFEPPLSKNDFFECFSIRELYNRLAQGNWILGQPFYYKNVCFINQINAGDEWLTIRDDLDFESITVGAFQYEEFKDFLKCVFNATEEQLRKLEYSTEEYKRKWSKF